MVDNQDKGPPSITNEKLYEYTRVSDGAPDSWWESDDDPFTPERFWHWPEFWLGCGVGYLAFLIFALVVQRVL